MLCFRRRPIFLGWSAAPPIPPATRRSFRVKVDQFPNLAPTRAFGPPGMSDSNRVQPDTPQRGLLQGRYRDEASGPIALDLGGRSLFDRSRSALSALLCQMRDPQGWFFRLGLANGEDEVGGSGVSGGGSSAPSRGAASRWGYREASAGSWAASAV